MTIINPSELYATAHEAGMAAGNACTPVPMTVVGQGKQWHVPDGVCGFASVRITPARGKLVSWLKANDIGYKSYQGGWCISCHEFGQSMTRKEAYTQAMAKVFRDAGLKAYSESRMD